MRLSITYDGGEIRPEIDTVLKGIFTNLGAIFYAQGYSLVSGKRDIVFDIDIDKNKILCRHASGLPIERGDNNAD